MFRYIIVENKLEENDDPKLNNRVVGILMDEKAFSENNLKTLFALVSKRFPDPDSLYVDVSTSLEQLATPEEVEDKNRVAHSGSSKETQPNKYYWALYFRGEGDEFFRYSPLNDKTDIKTVQLTKLAK